MQALFAIWVSMLAALGLLAVGAQDATPPQPEPSPVEHVSTSTPPVKKRPVQSPRYDVVKVVDGDTVVINMGGKKVTLRLIGMDAPETTTLRKGVVECFGGEATRRAEELLDGVSVAIETDSSQGEYDKYERTLAYVVLPDGKNFAELMIREGYAHEYTYDVPYEYQAAFKAAQKEARENKRGLWNPNACSSAQEQSAAPAQSAGAATPLGTYDCTKNTYNCSSFKTQTEAQAAFDSCGGSNNDIHKLDSDGDGRVCEGLR